MDNEQIQKILEGDRETFRELVEKHQIMVRSITRKFILSKEDAEDVAQQVFLEVFLSIKSFKGQSALSTWIYRIAVTKCIDFTRSRNRKARYIKFRDFFSENSTSLLNIKDSGIDPEQALSRSEQKEILYQALDRLPVNQKTALLLCKIDGMSYQEIADTLNTTISAVESLLHRGKTTLRKYLKKKL